MIKNKKENVYLGPIDNCIFCLDSENKRTDEHVMPYSYGGNFILRKATCGKCQKIINEEFEQKLAQVTYQTLRANHKFPSRSKNYPDTIPITFKTNIFSLVCEVALEEAPLEVLIPYYPLPPFWKEERDWAVKPQLKCTPLLGERERDRRWKNIFKKYPYPNGTIQAAGIIPETFPRLLLKIAVGFAKCAYPQFIINKNITEKILNSSIPFYDFKELFSAPAKDQNLSGYYKAEVFNININNTNHMYVSIRFLSERFPIYYCDLGEYSNLKINAVFEG